MRPTGVSAVSVGQAPASVSAARQRGGDELVEGDALRLGEAHAALDLVERASCGARKVRSSQAEAQRLGEAVVPELGWQRRELDRPTPTPDPSPQGGVEPTDSAVRFDATPSVRPDSGS